MGSARLLPRLLWVPGRMASVSRHRTGSGWHHQGPGCFSAAGVRVPVNSIFVFPLASDWRETLGGSSARVEPLEADAGPDSVSWADNEFVGGSSGRGPATQAVGEERRGNVIAPGGLVYKSGTQQDGGSDRILPDDRSTRRFAGHAGKHSCSASRTDAPADAASEDRLCIQDGSDLNFGTHGTCEGLGLIGKNQASKGTLGLHMHAMLILDGNGIPLGIPRVEYGPPEQNAGDGEVGAPSPSRRWSLGGWPQ